MDHELKQRLIGAVVVTALCAIFIPMLFDDPVDNSGQQVSELNISAPVESGVPDANSRVVPTDADQVLKLPEPASSATETGGDTLESTGAAEEVDEEPAQQGEGGESLYTESEGYTREDAGAAAVEIPLNPPLTKGGGEDRGKPSPKQPLDSNQGRPFDSVQGRPLLPEASPKAQVRDTHVEAAAKESAKLKKIVETVKPITLKKPGYGDDGAKAVATPAPVKQPGTSKSLAAAIAEANKPAVAPKAKLKLVRWYIQIGSFSKKENATSIWESLREQGLPAALDTVQTDKGTTYRLRVGPELDGKKAAAMKARLDKQNIKAILISE